MNKAILLGTVDHGYFTIDLRRVKIYANGDPNGPYYTMATFDYKTKDSYRTVVFNGLVWSDLRFHGFLLGTQEEWGTQEQIDCAGACILYMEHPSVRPIIKKAFQGAKKTGGDGIVHRLEFGDLIDE